MTTTDPGDDTDGWHLVETTVDDTDRGRREARFAQGNGYLGFRGVTEERYVDESRLFGVAGLFNRADGPNEVSEAVNVGDPLAVEIRFDDQRFALDRGTVESYDLRLDLGTGEYRRHVDWVSPAGRHQSIRTRRIASAHDEHLVAIEITVTVEQPTTVSIRSGIDGERGNGGVQHLVEDCYAVHGHRLRFDDQTTATKVAVLVRADHRYQVNGHTVTPTPKRTIGRRRVDIACVVDLDGGDVLRIEKFVTVHTSRDRDVEPDLDITRARVDAHLSEVATQGYEVHARRSGRRWAEFWSRADVAIQSTDPADQLALRFSLYHLRSMTAVDDDRMGISAKGFTGDGYKGHSFWDTEVYILPMWQLVEPEVADRLLAYRASLLPSARALAAARGYAGAMFPWESAWATDGEVTPTRGNLDVVTGERDIIKTGLLQHHITAVIAHAFWRHSVITGRDVADDNAAVEVTLEAARFWASRLDERDGALHIDDSIGPDEYKEHVDDNAFTMHLAHWCLSHGADLADRIRTDPQSAPSNRVDGDEPARWRDLAARMALPMPNRDGLIPQDRTYLELPDLPDVAELRAADSPFGVIGRYSLDQLSAFQVSKQADVAVLFHLLPDRFDEETQRRNLRYYEAKTLHDSSLSAAMYCLVALQAGESEIATRLWPRARDIDLGPHAGCAGGLHAAAMGGLWQVVVNGFGGVRIGSDGRLTVSPQLPDRWTGLRFTITYRGTPLEFDISPDRCLVSTPGAPALVTINGHAHEVGEAATMVPR